MLRMLHLITNGRRLFFLNLSSETDREQSRLRWTESSCETLQFCSNPTAVNNITNLFKILIKILKS